MVKQKFNCEMISWGIYTKWNRGTKELPRLLKFTAEIPARVDIEFGYVLKIKKGKNCKLNFQIEHPPFKDSNNCPAPPFKGELYVRTNDWDFFLGDTIWEPVGDKIGPWRLITWLDGTVVADKTLTVVADTGQFAELTGGLHGKR